MQPFAPARIVDLFRPIAHDEIGVEEPFFPHEMYLPFLLTSDPRRGEVFPLYVILSVLFGILLVGSLLVYLLAPRLLRRHRVRVQFVRRVTTALAAVSGLGLFWMVCRFVGAPLFARPLWLWFTLIALVGTIGYAVYYWRTRYTAEAHAYEEAVRRQRWMPTPRRRAAARRR